MPQTLLILFAVVLFGLYGYAQHERSAADERTAIRRELESAALGLATDWSARMRQEDFDEGTICDLTPRIKGASDALVGLSTALGPEFGETGLDPTTWNDVDDANGYADTLAYPVRDDDADFAVTIGVYYTDHDASALDSLGTPSLAKFARIRAVYVEPNPAVPAFRPEVFAEVEVRLSQAALTMSRLERNGVPSTCAPPPAP